jgi:hypothetical protein
MPWRVAGLAMSLAVSLALIGCATVPQPTASISASSLAAARPRPTASPSSAGTSTPEPSPGQGPPDATTVAATVRQNTLPPALSSVAFVNVATGWAGGSGVILGTTTAGSSWRTEWTGSRSIQSLSAVDQGHVVHRGGAAWAWMTAYRVELAGALTST